ncbi:MAG: hypothetical protein MK073_05305 [Phycisphaerales bacterium]|nr:hypothetical protein [Phycisphaerales bacterium]
MHIRICLLFVLSFIFGCSTRAPIATYQHAVSTEIDSDAASFEAVFNVSNTNNEPIELLLYEYSVSVDGSHVFTGLHEAKLTVPRWSVIESSIPIVVPASALEHSTGGWQLQGTLSYIESDAFADTLRKAGFSKPSTSVFARDTFDAVRAE